MMLRDQLVNLCSGILLDVLRCERGRLTFVSSEAQVNRKYFNLKLFRSLKLFRVIRVLYALAMELDRDEFVGIGQHVFAEIWDFQEEYGYTLLDEGKGDWTETDFKKLS